MGGNAIASIRPASTLTLEPSDLWPWPFACVWVMTIVLMGYKVEVEGQHGRSDLNPQRGQVF